MIKNLSKKHLFTVLFILIIIASLIIRTAPILNYNFPFTMDQGRDMVDIRKIVAGKDISLIGPTTSINGVFLGPFWYYFNVLPFVTGNGNPATLVYWMIIWYIIGALVLWYFFKKENKTLAFVTTFIFLTAPALIYSSRFSWSTNPMPFMSVFYLLALFVHIKKPNIKNAFFTALIAGLSFQIEAAFAVLFFPFLILVQCFKKVGIKNILFSFAGFTITLLPQLLFELKHNFLMTKVFINEVSGKSAILGDRYTFSQTLLEHFKSFLHVPAGLFQVQPNITILLVVISLIFLFYKLKTKGLDSLSKTIFLVNFAFIIFAYVFYLLYPHQIKDWYLEGLHIPVIFIISLFIVELYKLKNNFITLLLGLAFVYILTITFITQSKLVPLDLSDRSGDPSNFRNELEAVDWVYQKANGAGFKVFNYLPSVYDYPYQYIFWWYGAYKYGYHPQTISYLENVPEYIPENNKYLDKKRELPIDYLTFLIIEPDDELAKRQQAWLGNFANLCLQEKIQFHWRTQIQVLKNCPNK